MLIKAPELHDLCNQLLQHTADFFFAPENKNHRLLSPWQKNKEVLSQ